MSQAVDLVVKLERPILTVCFHAGAPFLFSPQLLVQFVQNASIPLVQGLEDSESKHSCLPLLAPAESSLCSPLELTGQQMLTASVLPCPPQAKTLAAVFKAYSFTVLMHVTKYH